MVSRITRHPIYFSPDPFLRNDAVAQQNMDEFCEKLEILRINFERGEHSIHIKAIPLHIYYLRETNQIQLISRELEYLIDMERVDGLELVRVVPRFLETVNKLRFD